MAATIAALFSHPIKGFTPQARASARLAEHQPFPEDRLFAVEDGASGFNPDAPAFVPKQRFTVLAKLPQVARVRTHYADGRLTATAPGMPALEAQVADAAGQGAFAGWLAAFLGEAASGPLKMLDGAGHRFTDHPRGDVSILNLASVRDLETRLGRPIDPLRFRANVLIEGWPAWAENDWVGDEITLGAARLAVFKPIVRCLATHVDPDTGEVDIALTEALHAQYGHVFCGVYAHVVDGAEIAVGDAADHVARAFQAADSGAV